jgi:tripartite-type tricarboxylate transporter receptor subunit TctC
MLQAQSKRFTLLALLASVLLIISLFTGCSSSSKDSGKQGSSNTPSETPKQSSSPEPDKKSNFPSKDITFVIPVTPGGGFDTYSRIFAQHLPKHLPNKVNVIVKNVPGGEWNIGIGEINRAKPDGHTIGIFNIPGNVINQIMGTAEFDLTKMTWIGKMSEVVYIGAASQKSGIKTFDDLINSKKKLKVGVVGLGSSAGLGSLLAFEQLGLKADYITHEGSTEAIMAAVRGDVDYVQYPYPTMKKFIIDSDQLTPIITYNPKRYGELKDIPTIVEKGKPEILDVVKMDYLIGGTPGIPDDVTKILRDAFQATMKDPEFVAGMEKAKQPVIPDSAEESLKIVESSLKIFAKYKDLVGQHMK